jgi:hypothetical protein
MSTNNTELRERLALVRDAIKPIKAFEDMAATVQEALDELTRVLVVPPELLRMGELVRTQDNRITSHPVFVVEQVRRVYGVDQESSDGRMWYDPRAVESYDDAGKLERDAERATEGGKPIEWQLGYYKETWEFVTACFTEQGCNDFIAANGHNLKEPRIYAYSAWRNQEWQRLRAFLESLPSPPAG